MTEIIQNIWDLINEFELVIVVLIGIVFAVGVRLWKLFQKKDKNNID